jgi:hypothetical protein
MPASPELRVIFSFHSKSDDQSLPILNFIPNYLLFSLNKANYLLLGFQILNGMKFDYRKTATPERVGNNSDLRVLEDEPWLKDTEVKYHIRGRRGRWEVSLIFIAVDNPLKFVKWQITICTTYPKAKLYGDYYRRLAAKDPRGYLKSDLDRLRYCNN